MHGVQSFERRGAFQCVVRGIQVCDIAKYYSTKYILSIHHHTINNRSIVKIKSALRCAEVALSNAPTM